MTDPPTTRTASTSYNPQLTNAPAAMSEDEARSFHGAFLMSFLGFTLIAAIAHYAVWQWRPWIPGTAGYEVRTAQTAPALPQSVAAITVQR